MSSSTLATSLLRSQGAALRPASRRIATGPDTHSHLFEWRSSGMPVLLLHGMGSNAATWRRFACELDERWRPLAVDLRGHGDSSWTSDYRLGSFVRDLEAVRDWISRPFAIVGHSLGAEVAVHFAAHHPDSVQALVLVDIGVEMDARSRDRIRALLAAEAGSYAAPGAYAEELRESYALADESMLQDVAAHGVRAAGRGGYVSKLDPEVRTRLDPSPTARSDAVLGFWSALAMLRCPTLVVRGELSAALRRESAVRMTRTLARGSLEQIPRAGHAVMLDNPEAFGRVAARFLSETLSGEWGEGSG
jgi:pimeloyl-ACP methyl ester carboxylesterase